MKTSQRFLLSRRGRSFLFVKVLLIKFENFLITLVPIDVSLAYSIDILVGSRCVNHDLIYILNILNLCLNMIFIYIRSLIPIPHGIILSYIENILI